MKDNIKECRVSYMGFADNCYLFASSKKEIRKMLVDTAEELSKSGLDWKEDQMELIAWVLKGKMGISKLKLG